MKKFLILASVCLISACSCMDDSTILDEPQVVYQNIQQRPQNCDYFDGKTCYRYVRRIRQQPVVRYREPVVVEKSCNKCDVAQTAPVSSSNCEDSIRETREPVEVVYKKTIYKTVYKPQTTTSVSYERVPYTTYQEEKTVTPSAPIEIVTPSQAQVEVVSPLTSEEEILLNVK